LLTLSTLEEKESTMRLKSLVIGLAAISTIFPLAASAQAEFTAENPWMVRKTELFFSE
jgi:hypothetical protein